jgi:hypothetical protein
LAPPLEKGRLGGVIICRFNSPVKIVHICAGIVSRLVLTMLIAGTHFLVVPNLNSDDLNQLDGESKNVEYKINIPKWEEWMISTSMSLGTD